MGTSLDVKEVCPDERVLEVERGLITRPEVTFIMPPLLSQLFDWIYTSPRGLTLTTLDFSFCCKVDECFCGSTIILYLVPTLSGLGSVLGYIGLLRCDGVDCNTSVR